MEARLVPLWTRGSPAIFGATPAAARAGDDDLARRAQIVLQEWQRTALARYNRVVSADLEHLLDDLNPPQREAVLAGEGPLLVLAGAGSGKTRVIAHRIAHVLGVRGVNPRNLIAVTFTNKAAEEMARRVESLLTPVGVKAPLVATFHSACVRILRQHIGHLDGYKPGFTIYDEDDRQALVKELMREHELGDKTTPGSIVHRISHAKNQMLSVADVERAARGPREEQIAALYARYQERLAQSGAVDFDDLLLLTVKLFEQEPGVLEGYRELWKHVLVDEYQDTNRAQYTIVRQLTSEHRNICCVGDPDQSVYRWRGADIRNILDFEADYPGTRVIRLEQNYRSTKRILAIAAGVIGHNVSRKDKTLWTENAEGEPAAVYRAWDEHEEANFVAQRILSARGERVAFGDVAIFYRTNAQSRVLEDALRRGGIPYLIVGGVRFYERKEIKDTLAYLRLIVNPGDDVAFRRAIAAPVRGIGPATLIRLGDVAAREGRSLLSMAATPPPDITAKPRRVLEEFAAMIERLASQRAAMSPAAFLDLVLSAGGYREALKQERSPEAEARLENLEELVAAAEDHSRMVDPSLESFLDTVALVSDTDQLPEGARGVTLMTLHSAKGLEFPWVFLTGLEEGVFPHARSVASNEEIEEERRLCYVGVTRAKERLFVSYALHRRVHGYDLGEASRFVREMPEEHLTMLNVRPEPQLEAPRHVPRYEPQEEAWPIKVGARVRHARFGEGLVVGVERDGSDIIVTVGFAAAGRKRLSLQYAHLEEI
jgi:DNA helicase II / ATP-dependent DNA helicase PcrA